MKHIRLLLAALCLAACSASATDIPEKSWEYEKLDDDHVVIHNYDQSRQSSAIDPDTEGDIVVPSTLRNMQVVSIGEKAFYNCSKLTSVVIPEGVTNIADNAFGYCTSLTNVVFPTSLKSIGTYAFYKCSKLAAANLTGASLTIDSHAFRDCSSIRGLEFSGDLISIGECAFSGCTALYNIVLTAKSVSAGKCAFSVYLEDDWTKVSEACTEMTNIIIVATDIVLGETSFAGCTGLRQAMVTAESVVIGERAFNIRYRSDGKAMCNPCTALSYLYVNSESITFGTSAFQNCTSLTNAMLIGSISATIGESVFSNCSKLKCVELPFALTDVPKCAFSRCSALESIAFSTNVTHISYQAFDTCTSLKTIDFVEGLTGIDAQAFYGCSSVTNLTFPLSLSEIGSRAFEKCEGLVDVIFSEGDTNLVAAQSVTIGERAFYQCSAITNVTLSQAVSSMGARAFSQCESLARINLPSNLTAIAESAFEDCSTLPTIVFPAALTSIGNAAFSRCSAFTGFLIPTNNTVTLGAKAFVGTKYWNDYPDDLVVNNGYILGFKGNPTKVTLPDGCKAIPVAMFEGMTTIKQVIIPDSVTEIGSRAFNGCTGITNLAFNSVTTIGNSAFEGCTSLTGITLSDVLTAIPGNAFKDCAALASIDIPDLVASVGEYAFYNCASLKTVTGGVGVTTVGDYAFAQCPVLQPFEFPSDVAYGDHVYQGCTWTEHVLFPSVGTLKDEYPATYACITSVVFSSNLSTITNGACAGCAALAYIRIPEGVSTIGYLAFDGCISLTSVVMSASATAQTNSFVGCGNIVSAVVSGKQSMRDLFPDSYATLRQADFVDGVTSLCVSQFTGCVALHNITIPSTVSSIGAYAFQNCRSFSCVNLPTNITSVASGTLQNCTGLTSIVIPDGVTSIESLAFDGCSSITSVVMSASVASVASTSFSGCGNVVSATVSGQAPLAVVFPDCYEALKDVKLADGIETLAEGVFSNCQMIAEMEIPWTVTTIGAQAFFGCSNLTEIVVPEYVTALGSQAFGNCARLRYVDYLCPNPESVDDTIYQGTRSDLVSRVLPLDTTWQTTNNVAGATVLPLSWPETGSYGRPIAWWAAAQSGVSVAQVHFSYNSNQGGGTNYFFRANAGRSAQGTHFPEDPERENYAFDGWWTQPTGGEEIEEGVGVAGSVTYYAHWVYDDEEGDDDDEGDDEGDDDDEKEEDPIAYDFTRANTYNGYLMDGDSAIGTVQIKFAKGKTNKKTGETTATATAYVQLLGESRITLKGTLLDDGSASLSVSKSERTMAVEIESDDANQLSGSFDGYDLVAYRDLFTSTEKDDKTRAAAFLASVSGKYTVVLAADGDTAFTSGYAPFSVVVGSKGKTKISGTMPDGTSVSGSMQLAVVTEEEDDTGIVSVVLPMYSKKGGLAFLLSFARNDAGVCVPTISALSTWISDKQGSEVPIESVGAERVTGLGAGTYAFAVDLSSLSITDVTIEDTLSPDGTAIAATAKKWTLPKSDTVRFVKGEGYVVKKDNGNPAALKLSYASTTGLFKGSFKMYGITAAGKSKTYTATVKGGVVGGVGYGTAVVKKVGSLPVEVE